MNTKEIQRVVRKYYKQLYANKLNNLDKMDKFPETYNHQKLNQEESENMNRQITPSKTEAVIKPPPDHRQKKRPGLHGFTSKFYQTFWEELTHHFSNFFKKMQEEGRFPRSSYEASVIIILNQIKTQQRKKIISQYP